MQQGHPREGLRGRPELNRMLDQLREGDIVTVWKLLWQYESLG